MCSASVAGSLEDLQALTTDQHECCRWILCGVRSSPYSTKPSGSRRLRPLRDSPATRGGTAGPGAARGGWPLPACGEPINPNAHQTAERCLGPTTEHSPYGAGAVHTLRLSRRRAVRRRQRNAHQTARRGHGARATAHGAIRESRNRARRGWTRYGSYYLIPVVIAHGP